MLVRLLRKLEPPHGYLVLGLLLGTVLCLPLGVMAAGWLSGSAALLGIALLATVTGFVAGLTPLPGWLVGLFGLLAGIEWCAATVGRLAPGVSAVLREAGRAIHWLWYGLHGAWPAEWPFLPLVHDVWARGQSLLARLHAWGQAGLSGGTSRDQVVLLLLASIVVWWLSYFAGWQVARRHSALTALAPAGAALLANSALTYGAALEFLRAFMGGALLLMALVHYQRQEACWQREGLDYSTELRQMAGLVGVGLSSLLVVVALAVPYVTWQQPVDLFWRYARQPYEALTDRLDRLFAARNPVARPGPGRHRPEGHELAGPVELGSGLVFYVATSDPPPVPPDEHDPTAGAANPQHYWRELTYTTYTGRGWENTGQERVSCEPGQAFATPEGPRKVLTQTYELRWPPQGMVPAANEPVLAGKPVTLVRHSATDLAGLAIAAREYAVVSHIPAPTVQQLREAGTVYPPEVAERYLALPAIPGRVRELAAQVAGEAPTPYDKAAAIERYLRAFDYDLGVPAPPPGEDAADYLLFQARRGYCDYYATAMAVMLRAVGVPARYAAGYAMGQYDYQRGAYAVTEREAHAWVEVYFPGYGWVEFEPTPYRSAFVRPAGGAGVQVAATPAPATPQRTARTLAGSLLALATAALALGGLYWWAGAALRARRGQTAAQVAQQVYAQMLRAAQRLRLGPAVGDTPLEFTERLGRAVEARGNWAHGAAEEARAIGRAYVLARYGSTPPPAHEVGRAVAAWARLRAKLRRLTLWRW